MTIVPWLYLVRHGETDYNREGRLQGIRDIPLNANGRAQAEVLRGFFGKLHPAAVVTSPLVRAKQTAEILAAGCPLHEEPAFMAR
ncbi:histidine phosphatase family protein, partial [bacterium]|nr:histidine phosphatase family protein [candidate division CSSED10-310 bacterium]